MNIKPLRYLPGIILLGYLNTASLAAETAPLLQEVVDFQALRALMQEKKLPLLLAIKAEHCNYCQRLEAEQLEPMERNAGYRAQILIRTFELGGTREITGFDGDKLTAAAFSQAYKAKLTPTILFLDANGKEIAQRMTGYNSPYYGAYLDDAITTAFQAVQSK